MPVGQSLGVMGSAGRSATFNPLCYTRANLIPCKITKLELNGLLNLFRRCNSERFLSQWMPRTESVLLAFALTAKPAKDDMSPLCRAVSRDLFPEWT